MSQRRALRYAAYAATQGEGIFLRRPHPAARLGPHPVGTAGGASAVSGGLSATAARWPAGPASRRAGKRGGAARSVRAGWSRRGHPGRERPDRLARVMITGRKPEDRASGRPGDPPERCARSKRAYGDGAGGGNVQEQGGNQSVAGARPSIRRFAATRKRLALGASDRRRCRMCAAARPFGLRRRRRAGGGQDGDARPALASSAQGTHAPLVTLAVARVSQAARKLLIALWRLAETGYRQGGPHPSRPGRTRPELGRAVRERPHPGLKDADTRSHHPERCARSKRDRGGDGTARTDRIKG